MLHQRNRRVAATAGLGLLAVSHHLPQASPSAIVGGGGSVGITASYDGNRSSLDRLLFVAGEGGATSARVATPAAAVCTATEGPDATRDKVVYDGPAAEHQGVHDGLRYGWDGVWVRGGSSEEGGAGLKSEAWDQVKAEKGKSAGLGGVHLQPSGTPSEVSMLFNMMVQQHTTVRVVVLICCTASSCTQSVSSV